MSNTTAAELIRAGLDSLHTYAQPVIDKAKPVMAEVYTTVKAAASGAVEKAQDFYRDASPVVEKWYQDTAQPAVKQFSEKIQPYTEPLGHLYDQTISATGVYARELLGDRYGGYVERALPNVFIALAISGFLWFGILMKQGMGRRSGPRKISDQSEKDANVSKPSKAVHGKKHEDSASTSSPPSSDHEKPKAPKHRTPKKGGQKQAKKAPVFPKPESLGPKPKKEKPAANAKGAATGKRSEAPVSGGKKAPNTDADGWTTVTAKRR